MVGAEGADEGGDGFRAHGVEETEGDLAGGRVGVGPYRVGGLLDLGEGPLGGAQEGAARRGEGDGAALAGEQGDSQVLFEPDHRPRQGRLRDAELLRGARDVLVAGHRLEVGQPRREHGANVFFVTTG